MILSTENHSSPKEKHNQQIDMHATYINRRKGEKWNGEKIITSTSVGNAEI